MLSNLAKKNCLSHPNLIKLCFVSSIFIFFTSYAITEDELLSRYPWVDKYKYIEQHSSVNPNQTDLDIKVQSLKSKIEQTLINQKNQTEKQNELEFQSVDAIDLTDDQKNQIRDDIGYIEANLANLGPNLKALLLKRLGEFQIISDQIGE